MSNVVQLNPPAMQEVEFQQEIRAVNLAFGKAADFANKSISQRVEAGRLLVKLRKDVEERGYDWWPWYRAAGFVRGRKDAEKVIALANDRDPEAAAEQERERNREAVRKHRAAQPKVTAYVSGKAPSAADLPPPAEGYVREYQHIFEHGTCHLLPQTKDYESPEWKQWRDEHPNQWLWRDRKVDAEGYLARDDKGRVLRAPRYRHPDGTLEAPPMSSEEYGAMIRQERLDALAEKQANGAADKASVSDVEAAEHVAENVLDTIKRQAAVANAYRKIFKVSSFDKEANVEIRSAIEALISKWQAAYRLVPAEEAEW
jgi:hypothetical protein